MGMKEIPNPDPIMSENVKNKNSTPVAKELSPKPRVAIDAPHIMMRRYPYRLHKMLPIKPGNKEVKILMIYLTCVLYNRQFIYKPLISEE